MFSTKSDPQDTPWSLWLYAEQTRIDPIAVYEYSKVCLQLEVPGSSSNLMDADYVIFGIKVIGPTVKSVSFTSLDDIQGGQICPPINPMLDPGS